MHTGIVIDFKSARFLAVARVLKARNPQWSWAERIAKLAQARARLEAGDSAASVLGRM